MSAFVYLFQTLLSTPTVARYVPSFQYMVTFICLFCKYYHIYIQKPAYIYKMLAFMWVVFHKLKCRTWLCYGSRPRLVSSSIFYPCQAYTVTAFTLTQQSRGRWLAWGLCIQDARTRFHVITNINFLLTS